MLAIDVYKIYKGLYSHFTTENFNYRKQGKHISVSQSTFSRRYDYYWFGKLAHQFQDVFECEEFFISHFLYQPDFFVPDLLNPTANEVYQRYKKDLDNSTRIFTKEINMIYQKYGELDQSIDGVPLLIHAYTKGLVGIQTLTILEMVEPWVDKIEYSSILLWEPLKLRIKKYKILIDIEVGKYVKKYKQIQKKYEVEPEFVL